MKASLRLKRSRSNSIQFLCHRFLEVAYLDAPKQVPAMRPDRPLVNLGLLIRELVQGTLAPLLCCMNGGARRQVLFTCWLQHMW